MLRKFAIVGAIACSTLAATSATAASIINLDGKGNASLNGDNAVNLDLAAGTYELVFVDSLFTAFNRFGTTSGCDSLGANCRLGFENSARFIIDGTTYLFGDGNASGGIGPQATGGYYSTAAQAFASSGVYKTSFTLASPGSASFFIYDDNLSDNTGGISLAVSAVPEPATWFMMLLGIGVIGYAMRKRSSVRATVSYA
ncbi:PEPxxWA-CTERM sorting domain-containing protein [Allopontixanthobacter sediminis]|uniref:PEPxxWA-CTERM sorting domain-containing protein n=1 Tax=Allopontixanthobacter sediminis TaxID=1689985 RepID=A0A845B2E6_9SPHN|nr:PEPxxWA-CTERM sorting domain-containing protein [Allopontixanthobacter sediminis]MXP44590.1 PEPxxWA-CTERM sorting domain-containing protein [Allopontixanthobacter sediminis]